MTKRDATARPPTRVTVVREPSLEVANGDGIAMAHRAGHVWIMTRLEPHGLPPYVIMSALAYLTATELQDVLTDHVVWEPPEVGLAWERFRHEQAI